MADTFGEEMNKEKNNSNRMAELENAEKKPSILKALKDKLVASDNDMQKMTSNRQDVKNATQRAIVSNPALTPTETLAARLDENADITGVNEPINHVSMGEAENGNTPTPVKTDGGSVLADAVDAGNVDDTFTSGMLGGTKDGTTLSTDEKREAAGLGPESFNVGGKVDGLNSGDGYSSGDSGSSSTNELTEQEQIAQDSALKQWQIAQKVLDEQNPYKSGADYLQALWGNGAKGKAQAIGNVLGNLLGAVGRGAAGQDYTSDWQKFKDEYTKQSQERRAAAAKNAQDMINTIAQNKEARAELVNALQQAKAQGANLSADDMIAIQNWQTATQPSSALNKAIASLVQSVEQQGLLGTAGGLIKGMGGKK